MIELKNKSYFTREEVEQTGLPFSTGHRWIGTIQDICILMTKSRCNAMNVPVTDDEMPVAFRYTVNGPGPEKYVPLFDRTLKVKMDLCYENELVESQN